MKAKKRLLLSALVFVSLLGIAYMLQATAPKPITANVRFDPETLDLEAPGWAVKEVLVTLWFKAGKYDGRDIDPKTVVIEGILEPKGGWKKTWTEKIKIDHAYRWVFRFNVAGGDMKDLLWSKIPHMDPGTSHVIPLEVTGLLYTEEPFTGTGYMTAYLSNPPPPNPF